MPLSLSNEEIASQYAGSSENVKTLIEVSIYNLDWGKDTHRTFTLDPERSGTLNTPNKVCEKIHKYLADGKALRFYVLPEPSVILIPFQTASKAVFEINLIEYTDQ